MSEYIKREDALNAIRKSPISNMSTRLFCVDAIADIPAADVVEVIRCKDCRFFAPDTYGDAWCSAKSHGVSKGMCSPSGDSYCSDAERR